MILGPGLPEDGSLKLASVMDLQYPEISVVLVVRRRKEVALQAMRSGVRDLLDPTADPDPSASCGAGKPRGCRPPSRSGTQQLRTRANTAEGGRIIAVMSPKGGVGKTTVATNLAVGLGKVRPMSVVIVDLDLQFGDVASGLMLDPEHTITDAVVGAASQDSMVLKTYLTVHPAGIYALCAPRNPVEMDRITGEHVTHLLNQLRQEFHYVVVDTAPGLGEHVLATLEQATDAVWICGMDIPSIRGLRTGFQILAELESRCRNSGTWCSTWPTARTGLTLQDVEATIGAPVDVVLPRSRTLPFSTNKGVPVLQDGSRDPAGKGPAPARGPFQTQLGSQTS